MASAVIGALRVNLGIDSAQFQNGLKNAQSGLQRFGAMAKEGLVAVAAASAAAAGAMAIAVKGAINAADDMSKAAQKIGIPTEELSRLKYAADLSGVSFEQLQTAVGRMSRVMNDAKGGVKEAVDTFAQLGISATNADGSLKSASEVLAEVADKFAQMPDGAEKTALAMELMGRAGAGMIPMLNGGSAALQNLMAEADTFGQVFTDSMGKDAEAFNDNITRLTGTIGNLAARIATELLPHMVRFTDWLVANAPQIAAVTTAVAGFVLKLIELQYAIAGPLMTAWELFNQALDASTMGAAKVADAIVAMKDMAITAVTEMVNAITEWVTTKLNAVWDSVTGKIDAVRNSFYGLYDAVVGHSYIPDMVQEVGQWMAMLDQNMVQPAADAANRTAAAFDNVGTSIDSVFSSIGSSIAGAIKGTKEWSEVLLDILSQLGRTFLSQMNFGGGFGSLIQGLLGGLLGFANGGSFTVGGTGGIDSQMVAFRATPGETVDVRKPGQDGGGGMNIALSITGTLVDDGGVIKARIDQAERRAAATGAAAATRQVRAAMPSLMAETQTRNY